MPAEVRQAAAVNFKNHVKRHWYGTGRDVRSLDDGAATAAPIPDSEKVRQFWVVSEINVESSQGRTSMSHHFTYASWAFQLQLYSFCLFDLINHFPV